jgi:hypothetical protein
MGLLYLYSDYNIARISDGTLRVGGLQFMKLYLSAITHYVCRGKV